MKQRNTHLTCQITTNTQHFKFNFLSMYPSPSECDYTHPYMDEGKEMRYKELVMGGRNTVHHMLTNGPQMLAAAGGTIVILFVMCCLVPLVGIKTGFGLM